MTSFLDPTMSLIEDPVIFPADAAVDMASIFGPDSAGLAGLLGSDAVDVGDDGYATTVEEDDFLTSTGTPDFGGFSVPDLKSQPGLMVDDLSGMCKPAAEPQSQRLPMELAFSPRNPAAFTVPHHEDQSFGDDASAAALLQILTQAALQQTQMQQSLQPPATSPTLESAPSLSLGSISPREVSPSSQPAISPKQPRASAPSVAPTSEFGGRSRTSLSPSTDAGSSEKRKRRVVDASDLLPLDAPVQKRTYLAPSATSRRELPEEDEADPSVQAILAKRKKNTLAARQSRRRKAEEMTQLREEKDQLAQQNAELRQRLEQVERELAAARSKLDLL